MDSAISKIMLVAVSVAITLSVGLWAWGSTSDATSSAPEVTGVIGPSVIQHKPTCVAMDFSWDDSKSLCEAP